MKVQKDNASKGPTARMRAPTVAKPEGSGQVDEIAGHSVLSLVDEPSRRPEAAVTVTTPSVATAAPVQGRRTGGAVTRLVTRNQEAPGPRTAQRLNRLRALRLVNRFRQLRSIDLAAGLFPEREFKAALSAVQRLTKSLVELRMLLRYRSLSGQTYYGLGEVGARWLRQNGDESDGDAHASASRVCEKTNPEHALWSALVTLCCEARGLWAMSEKELIPHLVLGPDFRQRHQMLVVSDERGKPKALMPDAIAHDGRNLVWAELDRSERGSARLSDLAALVRNCGREVNLGAAHTSSALRLRHVVVLCKTERIYRKHLAYVTGVNPSTGTPRLRNLGGQSALRQVAPGVYDVLGDVEKRLVDGRVALQREVVGRVHFQMLPTWLPGFSYRPGSRHDGWLTDGYLPFKNAPRGWHAS
jgi:hypothetical protein